MEVTCNSFACKKAHARCSDVRPCQRCVKLGIECVEYKKIPKEKKFTLQQIDPKTLKKKSKKMLTIQTKKNKKMEKSSGLTSSNMSIEEELMNLIEISLEPINLTLSEHLVRHIGYHGGMIVVRPEELTQGKFKFLSPRIRQAFGYDSTSELSLTTLLSYDGYIALLNEIERESEERKTQGKNHISLETESFRNRLLYTKDGGSIEVMTRTVKTFKLDDPTQLECLVMYIYWI